MTEYLRIIRRHLVVIALGGLIAGAAATAYVLHQPKRYDATACVQIYNLSSPLQTRGGQSDLTRAMLTQIAIVHGDGVRAAVGAAIGAAPGVRVQPAGDADVLNITARASSPARAVTIANAYANAYVDVGRQRSQDLANQIAETLTSREEALQAQIDALTAQMAANPSPALQSQRRVLSAQMAGLLASGSDASLRSAANSLEASVVQVAQPTGRPAGPSHGAVIASAASIGLLLAFAAACALETARRRRHGARRNRLQHVPVFGPVAARQLQPLERGRSRELRLLFDELDRSGALADSVVEVTGTAPSDVVAAVAIELALSLSDSGHSVVVADCDSRRPQLHQLCELPRSPGLTEVLAQRSRLTDAAHVYRYGTSELHVISSGSTERRPTSPAALGDFVTDALSTYDFVVLVTSPEMTVGRRSPVLSGGVATVVVSDDKQPGGDSTSVVIDSLLKGRVNVAAIVRMEGGPPQADRRSKANGRRELPTGAELHD